MRILFLLIDSTRPLERILGELDSRGHQVHLVVRSEGLTFENIRGRLVARACERYEGVTRGNGPVRNDRWAALSEGLGLGVDYLRYLTPVYANAPYLRARAQVGTPSKVVKLTGWPFVRSRQGIRALGRTMRWLESAIPDDREILSFLRSQRPDLLLISPLVTAPSQAHYVRAARSLGIRSAALIPSWDNLTNKGLIREAPDRLYVWNEDQRREAVELHGVPEDRVLAVGAYPFDHWFGWRPSTTAAEFRRRLGFPEDGPLILYACSSSHIAPQEPSFVERWLAALRQHPDQRLRGANILVRPHPKACDRWKDSPLRAAPRVAVWPTDGAVDVDDEFRAHYFDSIHHSAAVVGLNTSALIESAIVGRTTFTVLDPQHEQTQQGTLHFRYLKPENGGPVTVARHLSEHLEQLAQVLSGAVAPKSATVDFVRRFVRPHGLDHSVASTFAEALEEQMASPAPRPQPARVRRMFAAAALQPTAVLASWSVESRATQRLDGGAGRRVASSS